MFNWQFQMLMQVKSRDETLAKDEERHQQLKEESKKQVIKAGMVVRHGLYFDLSRTCLY